MSHNDNQSCVRVTRLMAVLRALFHFHALCSKFKLTYFLCTSALELETKAMQRFLKISQSHKRLLLVESAY